MFFPCSFPQKCLCHKNVFLTATTQIQLCLWKKFAFSEFLPQTCFHKLSDFPSPPPVKKQVPSFQILQNKARFSLARYSSSKPGLLLSHTPMEIQVPSCRILQGLCCQILQWKAWHFLARSSSVHQGPLFPDTSVQSHVLSCHTLPWKAMSSIG